MTSNQLTYWRNEEEKRANRAKEDENRRSNLAREAENLRSNMAKEAETHRANIESEKLRDVANALEKEGIELKKKEDLLRYAQLVAEYGNFSLSQLPWDVQQEITGYFGVPTSSAENLEPFSSQGIASWWDELKRVVGGVLGGGKGIAALF